MRMINRLLEDASDAQSAVDRILDRVEERMNRPSIVRRMMETKRPVPVPVYFDGENRQQRRAREREEKKAAARARKVAA